MQTKIAFVVPYFGKFPVNFQLWLNSCAWNPCFDWLIFTDDKTHYDYPPNVKVEYFSFGEIRKILQSHFDFAIDLPSPYKFCDYKPAYGEIFSNWLLDYDFWGYCDIDLVWGDLKKWINDDSLLGKDRVSEWGHCCLFRNNKRINSLYKTKLEGIIDYKQVFSSECNYLFDEEGGGQKIFDHYNLSTLTIPLYDVRADKKVFTATCATEPFMNEKYRDIIFEIFEGHVYMVCCNKCELVREEFAYVHMAKRAINIEIELDSTKYLLIPNKYIAWCELSLKDLKKLQPKIKWYPQYKWKGIKGKINVLLGKNKIKWPGSRLQKISDFIHGKQNGKK